MDFVFTSNGFWLLALPVSIGILALIYRRTRFIIRRWFEPDTYSGSFPLLKFLLRACGLILLVVALLGPYFSKQKMQVNIAGREIYLLLDVSSSMNAEDIRPSRLEKAKKELTALIQTLKGDKIGLIVFADQAIVQCPMTLDHQAVSLFLDLANTDQFAQTGTNFRDALGLAMDRFMTVENRPGEVTKAVIMVTDGEDFGDNFTSIIKRYQQYNINAYMVGIGTYAGGAVPQFVNGKKRGNVKHEDGTPVVSRLEDDVLKNLSESFGTQYHSMQTPFDRLTQLSSEVRMLTSSPLEVKMEQIENNLYQGPGLLAFFLLAISLFIMPRKKS